MELSLGSFEFSRLLTNFNNGRASLGDLAKLTAINLCQELRLAKRIQNGAAPKTKYLMIGLRRRGNLLKYSLRAENTTLTTLDVGECEAKSDRADKTVSKSVGARTLSSAARLFSYIYDSACNLKAMISSSSKTDGK
jgi:hypothetical protein